MVVGSPFDDISGLNDVGSAYVYTRSGTTWTEQQVITALDGAEGDQFGWRVSISGDTLVAGAPFDDVGAQTDMGSAYVFVRSGTVWSESKRVSGADGGRATTWAPACRSPSTPWWPGRPGTTTRRAPTRVRVRVRALGHHPGTEQQKLLASDAQASDTFGGAVAVAGDDAVVGAPDETSSEGAVYVFVRSGTTWTEQQKIVASDSLPNDGFGSSVSIWGNTIVAGAPFNNVIVGAAYVFVRSGTTWTEQQKLVTGAGGIEFAGVAVSVYGDTAMVGAHASGVGVGSTYAFARAGTTWTFQQRLLPPY